MNDSSEVVHEKSCGVVVFHKKGDTKEYLLLHYPEGHWDLAKGHTEKDETEKETALRELVEETGIKGEELIEGFREKIHYFFRSRKGELISKNVVFFMFEASDQDVALSHEHQNFDWLSYEKAYEKCTFKNVKEILEKANKFLQKLDN